MKIAVPKERAAGEKRAALVPGDVARLTELGLEVEVEAGLGTGSGWGDEDYQQAGATVNADRTGLLGSGDLVLAVRPPETWEVVLLKAESILVSAFDAFREGALVKQLAAAQVSTLDLDLMPREPRTQRLDAGRMQALLAGYVGVTVAAERLNRVFPLILTSAGRLPRARVLVLGAGAAGMQAIATARRLGARVTAYDVRPEAAEEIASLGAHLLAVPAATGETADSAEAALAREREAVAAACAEADVVIAAARVPGQAAPQLVTAAALAGMTSGSVVVDLAAESGGNVAGTVAGQEVEYNGVRVMGFTDLPNRVARSASELWSGCLMNLVSEYWEAETSSFVLDETDAVIQACLVTDRGRIPHEAVRRVVEPEAGAAAVTPAADKATGGQ